jgi:hypothetical protein
VAVSKAAETMAKSGNITTSTTTTDISGNITPRTTTTDISGNNTPSTTTANNTTVKGGKIYKKTKRFKLTNNKTKKTR